MTSTPTRWEQAALIPIHYPVCELRTSWLLPADGRPTQVPWKILGLSTKPTLLAQGIDWVQMIHSEAERAELLHDLIRRTLDNLSPF